MVGMNSSAALIIFLMLLSPSCFSYSNDSLDHVRINDPIVESIYFLDLERMASKGSCVSDSYLISIGSSYHMTLKHVNECKQCLGDDIYGYYCDIAKYNYFLRVSDYSNASGILDKISTSSIYSFLDGEFKKSITMKSNYLSKLSIGRKIKYKEMTLEKHEGRFYFNNYLVDSGSSYSTSKLCVEKLGGVEVNFISGTQRELNLCIDEESFVTVQYSENILGVLDILSSDHINFGDEKGIHYKQTLYIDNETFFFIAEYNGDKINICLDSGAVSTLSTSKFFSKIKDMLVGTPTSIMNINNSFLAMSVRAKILERFKIYLGDHEITLENVPVLIDRIQWSHCDLIAGSDFISNNLKVMDIKNNAIYIKRN